MFRLLNICRAAATLAAAIGPLTAFAQTPWRLLPDVPEPRSRAAGAMVGDAFYYMGGEGFAGWSVTCYKIDVPGGSWTPIANMPPPGVSNVDAAAIGSDIYLVGGFDGFAAAATNRVLRYDTIGDRWEEVVSDPLPTPLFAYAAAAHDDKLYILGGISPSGALITVGYVYDSAVPAGSRWSVTSPIPVPRRYPGAVAIDGKVYVIGGRNAAGAEVTAMDVYDILTNTWTTSPPNPTINVGRGGPAVFDLGGAPHVVAGGWQSYLATGEVLRGGAWEPSHSCNTGVRTVAHGQNDKFLVKVGGWNGLFQASAECLPVDAPCYPDCDGSGTLDFFDFLCFQNAFLAGDPYADCDGNSTLDFFDFLCFQNQFLAGCP